MCLYSLKLTVPHSGHHSFQKQVSIGDKNHQTDPGPILSSVLHFLGDLEQSTGQSEHLKEHSFPV